MIKSIDIQNGQLHHLFLLVILFIVCSCGQRREQEPAIVAKKDTLKPPVVISVKNPVIVHLDTLPPPQTIIIPTKAGGSHIIKTDAGVLINEPLLPPKTFTTDFLLSMQNYNTEQGLAYSVVISSYCDRKGNLWFGTYGGGVSRYDGKSFINFTTDHGLTNNSVQSIIEDKSGNLWFGTLGGGVSRYNGKSFVNFTTNQGFIGDNVYSIFEDKNGAIWFGTTGGASRLDHDKINLSAQKTIFKNYTIADGLVSNGVSGITEDKSGNIWFASGDKGVGRYDGKSFTSFTTDQGLANNSVYDILTDRNGNIWFATSGGGASYYNGKSFTNYTTKQGLIADDISGIFEEKNGDLWFETRGGGLSCLDYTKKTFTNYTTSQGLFSNNIWSIVQDKTGDLWFSSFGSGVARLNSNITYCKKLLLSIFEDKNGSLWLGSDGGGLGQLNIRYSTSQGLMNNHVFCIKEDKKGNLWCGTLGGVSQFDTLKKSFTTYTSIQGLSNDTVICIYEDKNGALWFGTSSGLSMLDSNKKTFTNYTTAQGLAGNYISGIYRDENKNLWICTDEGVSKYDGKTFTNYTLAQGLANRNTIDILEDKKGNCWVVTYGGGLSRLDRQQKTFINFTTEQGLADDKATAIAMDSAGIIWLGTEKGLTALKGFTSYSPANQEDFFLPAVNELPNKHLESNYKPVFEVYNDKTGYPVKGINGNVMIITHDDIIWAGTSDKLIRFDHNAVYKNTDTPNVFIQNIQLNNENISWYAIEKTDQQADSTATPPNIADEMNLFGKILNKQQRDTMRKKYSAVKFDSITAFYPVPVNLVLPYDHNDITFDFAAIEPARPGLVQYQYILEGYQDDWSPLSNDTRASFGNIDEGNYTFKLKAQSPDGVWSQPVIYTFQVLPPWWRTWWAYTVYVLAFIFVLWSFIKWRERTLKKEKTLLEEKVVERTHELQEEKEKVESTLTELKSTQAQLIQSEKMASLGELTAGIAHEIQNPLNFVNNFSEVNKEMLEELKAERLKPKAERDEQTEDEILNDVIANEEKINHHGKRADAIVKGMLLHSQTSTGQKELTDINKLADEYLRLSYQGLRAKDKSFNVTLQKNFDETIEKINIIPQDIGRVLLNLYNNAFYAVGQKQKAQGKEYEAILSVTTKKIGDKPGSYRVEIKVADNGNGIPQKLVDKIFQPFFTTKPAGQGTGLGLSLAYDIVKAQGGEIKVEAKENEGAEFILILPF